MKKGKQVDDLLLREDEAIATTKLSKTTLWRLRRDGLLRVIKVGRSVRYPASELQRWVDRQLERIELEGAEETSR